MDLKTAQLSTKAMLQSLSKADQDRFVKWIKKTCHESLTGENGDDRSLNGDGDGDMSCSFTETSSTKESILILESIRQDLQSSLPPSCILESESILSPQGSATCGGDYTKVEHVDAFVYDDEDLDIACERGQFSRSYCGKCGSRDIKDLDFISHSFSVDQVKFISRCLLSEYADKVLMDIGSRTGALLYGASLFTSLRKCVGIEINKEFTDLSSSLVKKYKMSDRITILNEDILNCASHMQQADIVVMNNVFEFFKDAETRVRLWQFCLDEIRRLPGRILITVPAVSQSLSDLQMSYDISFLREISTEQKVQSYLERYEEVEEETLSVINVYRVASSIS